MPVRVVKVVVVLLGGALLGSASYTWWSASAAPTHVTTPLASVTTTMVTTTTTLSPSTTSLASTTTTAIRGTLVIHGTGDVAVDPDYIPALATRGWDHAWSGLDGLFLSDDVTVINLECAPSDIGVALEKEFAFRCPTEALPSIRAAGVEVANLGNNHSADFGKEALIDGRSQLTDNGIMPVGAGRDYAEAGAPAILEVKGWKVAVVGFGGVAPSESWYATDDRPGMRSGDDTDGMVAAVRAADEIADIVVVTVHWGVELDTRPRADDVERARAMIEAGADVIFGHHPHRLQPFEMIEGAAVFWSLGNFVWPHNSVPSATTAVARVVVAPDGTVEACLIPAFIESHGHPVLRAVPDCVP